jgi:hypothetical protein
LHYELFSFGNGSQAIDIAGACFDHFSKCALKSLDRQAAFESAIRQAG